MLSDAHLQLLTAFVDGELSRRQRKAVLRLLHRSSEARSVLSELQENAHLLKQLPHHHRLPRDFSDSLLQEIARRGLRPAPAVRSSVPRRSLPFRWLAAAACVLIAAGIWGAVQWSDRGGRFSHDLAQELARDIAGRSLAAQPMMVALHELGNEKRRQELTNRVRREKSVHLDMPVADARQAVDQLGAALKAGGIRVFGEPQARKALQRDMGKGQVLVYAENLDPEELLQVLDHLTKKAPRTGSAFGTMTVSSLDEQDRRTLSRRLGIEEADLTAAGPVEFDPFSTMTIEDPSPKKSKKSGPRPVPATDRLAVVLAADASGRPHADVRAFLDRRTRLRPGAVRVLVVLHSA